MESAHRCAGRTGGGPFPVRIIGNARRAAAWDALDRVTREQIFSLLPVIPRDIDEMAFPSRSIHTPLSVLMGIAKMGMQRPHPVRPRPDHRRKCSECGEPYDSHHWPFARRNSHEKARDRVVGLRSGVHLRFMWDRASA